MKEMKRDKARRGYTFILGIIVLALLMLVSIAGAVPYAYITNIGNNSVSVIDTETDTIKDEVNVGSYPIGVAVTPDGSKVYVANSDLINVSPIDTVSIIDTATNTVIATVPVESHPYGVAVSPDGKKVYVTYRDQYITNVSVIDTSTNKVTATIPVGFIAALLAVTPDGKKVYVANDDGNDNENIVSIIDTATYKVTRIKVGNSPFGVAVSSDGKKVYVTNSRDDTVSIIDTTTNTAINTVKVGDAPCHIAINPAGTKVYVINHGSDDISIIDTATNTVTDTLNVGMNPSGVSFTPDGKKVYVANTESDTVSVINAATNTVTTDVYVGYEYAPVAAGQFIGPVTASFPVLPVANFVTNVTEGDAPLTIQFTDLSTNATSVNWDFGDKSNSTERNPVHEYSDPGIYTVNLTASNENGIDLKSATITVTEKSLIPVAAFSASPTSGKAPLKVAFIDKSTGSPTKWKWSFGDGTTSTIQNPTHKYSNLGNYTVSLTATNAEGNSTTTKTDYIKVVTKPVANFSAKPISGKAQLNVAFTDTSTGVLAGWIWNFGDGSKSFLQSPIHKYSKAGIYTVNLTVKNAAGRDTVTKTELISVISKPVANFTGNITSGKAPLNVKFTDTSTGTASGWIWEFGDGSKSFYQNPTHKYSRVGTYTVNLAVKNAAGHNTVTKTDYIIVVTKPVA
jgi:YVTN family beta-propeller protein